MCDRKSFATDFDFLLHAGDASQSGARGIRRGDLIGVEGYVGRNQRGEVPFCFNFFATFLPCIGTLLSSGQPCDAGVLLRDGPHHARTLRAPLAQGDPTG
jgi:hypothetical protein